jgi:hypothetical protein
MNEDLIYNFAFEVNKWILIIKGLDYVVMPGLHELFEVSKSDFAKLILSSEHDINQYRFVLSIKQIK